MRSARKLTQFAKNFRRLPEVLAKKVADEAADVLTDLGHETFDAQQTPTHKAWAKGAKGQIVTLRKSGDLEEQIHYVAQGTQLRVDLGVPYAKYQIGKRPVFPRKGKLPATYRDAIKEIVERVAVEELHAP